MRRLLVFLSALAIAGYVANPALAQSRRDRGAGQPDQDAAKKKKRDDEWGNRQAPLPALRNAGPCPFVKVLYDAARYVQFKDNQEASAAVAYTGEIEGVSAACSYKDDDPIEVKMEVLFELGKGPQATSREKAYRYWVAVTKRNDFVIDKQYFDLPVRFPDGEDRVSKTETIDRIVIPRATMATSGANFEILVGFDVTPQMAAFNRDGKRFRANVGGATATQ